MSAYWKGNLRNTRTDVLIDSALLVLSVCAYIPQISRLRKSTSTQGISPYYILFNVLFSNAQLSEMLLLTAYAWPNNSRPALKRIVNGSLQGLAAFGAILGLLQIFVQWSCSITVLMLFATHTQAANLQKRIVSMIALLHAAAVLFPAIAFTLPKPSEPEFGKDILMALIGMSNEIVAPCFGLLQFFAQFREMQVQHGEPGALSLLSIGLQVPAMLAMGFRWFLRLGKPDWGFTIRFQYMSEWRIQYEWGFPAINYVAHATGCAVLLACYLFTARETAVQGDLESRAPLLG